MRLFKCFGCPSLLCKLNQSVLHHYQKAGLDIPITMDSPIKDRASVDIQKTVASNKNILKDLPQAHALTGCDTVATCHGIGICKVLKLLKQGHALPAVGNVNADMEDVILQATRFPFSKQR